MKIKAVFVVLEVMNVAEWKVVVEKERGLTIKAVFVVVVVIRMVQVAEWKVVVVYFET